MVITKGLMITKKKLHHHPRGLPLPVLREDAILLRQNPLLLWYDHCKSMAMEDREKHGTAADLS